MPFFFGIYPKEGALDTVKDTNSIYHYKKNLNLAINFRSQKAHNYLIKKGTFKAFS